MFPIALKTLNDQERHDYILKTFILNRNHRAEQRKHKRDIDVIRDHHRFLWDDGNEITGEDTWEIRLARRYYDKLFKEYCIADLSRYKENKVALRWRTEAEVIGGIGQFQCGNRKCMEKDHLRSWEVNFAYQEQGERKNALVKVRLCPEHSEQLNYTSKKREVKRLQRMERKQVKEAKRYKRKSSKSNPLRSDSNTEVEDDEILSAAEKSEKDKEPITETEDEIAINSTKDNKKPDETETLDDIWNKKVELEVEPISRETEFEHYLQDLLL